MERHYQVPSLRHTPLEDSLKSIINKSRKGNENLLHQSKVNIVLRRNGELLVILFVVFPNNVP